MSKTLLLELPATVWDLIIEHASGLRNDKYPLTFKPLLQLLNTCKTVNASIRQTNLYQFSQCFIELLKAESISAEERSTASKSTLLQETERFFLGNPAKLIRNKNLALAITQRWTIPSTLFKAYQQLCRGETVADNLTLLEKALISPQPQWDLIDILCRLGIHCDLDGKWNKLSGSNAAVAKALENTRLAFQLVKDQKADELQRLLSSTYMRQQSARLTEGDEETDRSPQILVNLMRKLLPHNAQTLLQLSLTATDNSKQMEMIEQLLVKAGSDQMIPIHAPGTYSAPLEYAVINKNIDLVRLLMLDTRCCVAKVSQKSNATCLQLAAQTQQSEICKELCKTGLTDINYRNSTMDLPIHLAYDGMPFPKRVGDGKYRAMLKTVSVLIALGADLKQSDNAGVPLFHKAAAWGDSATIAALLRSHIPSDSLCEPRGQTAVHYAVQFGGEKILPTLKKAGVPFNRTDKFGKTALYYAIAKNQADVVERLLECGVDINLAESLPPSLTPIQRALRMERYTIAWLLWKRGARLELDLNSAPCEKEFLLIISLGNQSPLEVIKRLLESGADPECKRLSSEIMTATPLQLACRSDDIELINLLCDYGADPKQVPEIYPLEERIALTPGYGKINVLHYHVMKNNVTFVRFLLERAKMSPDTPTEMLGETPLFLALSQPEMFKLLINTGANVNLRSRQRETVLHQAACFGKLEALKLLLNSGAHIDLTDGRNTALQLALDSKHFECAQLLLANKANFGSKEQQDSYYGRANVDGAPESLLAAIQFSGIQLKTYREAVDESNNYSAESRRGPTLDRPGSIARRLDRPRRRLSLSELNENFDDHDATLDPLIDRLNHELGI